MENLTIDNDISVFGIHVKTFPAGIAEAFNALMKATGDGAGDRSYYGISYCDNGTMVYKAVAAEKTPGEAEKYSYPETVIEKGKYLIQTLQNWQSQTACIKDIFQEMMKDGNADKTKPCIEWYKNDEEMLCMIRVKVDRS